MNRKEEEVIKEFKNNLKVFNLSEDLGDLLQYVEDFMFYTNINHLKVRDLAEELLAKENDDTLLLSLMKEGEAYGLSFGSREDFIEWVRQCYECEAEED